MSELMQQKRDGLLQDKMLDPKVQNNELKAEKQGAPNSNVAQEAIGSAMITAELLNVRSGPGVSNSKVGTLKRATKIEVLSEKDGWLEISYNGNIGYVSAAYTSFARKDNAAPSVDAIGSAQVTANALNVRTGPGTGFGKIGILKTSDNVKVYGEKDGWLEIRLDGKVAYISAQYTNFTKTAAVEKEEEKSDNKTQDSSTQSTQVREQRPEQVSVAKEEDKKEEVSPEQGSVIDKATVTASSLNIRAGAAQSSTKIGTARLGQSFDVLAKEGDWLKVAHNDGVAYIHANYTVLQSTLPKPLKEPDFSKADPELKALYDKPRLSIDEIRRARELIDLLPEEDRGDYYELLQAKNYYHSQRDNESKNSKNENIGDVMCNLTSLAMCLEQLGIANPHPEMQYEDALEKIRIDNGYAARTSSTGWGAVAKKLGVNLDWLLNTGSTRAQPRAFWQGRVRSALREGKAVMGSVHGHIIRFQQVTDQGVIVDDPYGQMKLLAGSSRRWVNTNDKESSTSQVGEDHLIPFEELDVHFMHWVVAFY
ncbi:MAG: SH3 domain-containing protein [Bradymonadales bacterium]